MRLENQNYGGSAYEMSTRLFVSLIVKAYEREVMSDLRGIWKLNVMASAFRGKEILTFDEWKNNIKERRGEINEEIDPDELVARIKKDLGKG